MFFTFALHRKTGETDSLPRASCSFSHRPLLRVDLPKGEGNRSTKRQRKAAKVHVFFHRNGTSKIKKYNKPQSYKSECSVLDAAAVNKCFASDVQRHYIPPAVSRLGTIVGTPVDTAVGGGSRSSGRWRCGRRCRHIGWAVGLYVRPGSGSGGSGGRSRVTVGRSRSRSWELARIALGVVQAPAVLREAVRTVHRPSTVPTSIGCWQSV